MCQETVFWHSIEGMPKVIEIRDLYTSGHQERVNQLSTWIVREMLLSKKNETI